MLLPAMVVIALPQYWGFLKCCLPVKWVSIGGTHLTQCGSQGQAEKKSVPLTTHPLGFTEDPLSRNISIQLSGSKPKAHGIQLALMNYNIVQFESASNSA